MRLMLLGVILVASAGKGSAAEPPPARYFDTAGRSDVLSGGARTIEVQTPKGKFKVWTKRVGNNPRIKLLLLHGGPGGDARVLRGVRQFSARGGD